MKNFWFLFLCIGFVVSCDNNNDDEIIVGGLTYVVDESPMLLVSNRGGKGDIWLKEGEDYTRITDFPGKICWWPRIQPGTNRFIFYRSPESIFLTNDYENAELCAMNLDGSNFEVLISKGSYGWQQMGVADWNPDGSQLVMAGLVPSGGLGQWHIFITDQNGENPVQISKREGLFADPSFSPDGSQITYISCAADDISCISPTNWDVYIMDADGENEIQLTSDAPRTANDPYWSWDGTEIVFESALNFDISNVDLLIVAADGSHTRALRDDDIVNTVGRWSKEDDHIYFTRDELGFSPTKFHIARINRDGSGAVAITDGKYQEFEPELLSNANILKIQY